MITNFMNKKLILTFYINTVFLIILSLNTQKLEADEIFQKGREIFLDKGMCASCHTLSDAGSQANIGPNLNEIRPNIMRVIAAVTNGIGVMPAYQGELSSEEIEAVAHYVSVSSE